MDRKLGGLIALVIACNASAADGWSIRKKSDAMTDARTCTVSHLGGYSGPNLITFVDKDGVSFLAGAGAYPRTHAGVRVDELPAVSVREDQAIRGTEASALLAQLQAGKTMTTRYYSWPRRIERVGSAPIGDLPSLIAECQQFVKGE